MSYVTSVAGAPAALEALWPGHHSGPRVSLDLMCQILDYLGNPQDSFKAVHVAGTSGKTSTAYYAAALLQAAGKRVGLAVSPHVDLLDERLQINLTPLPEAEFCGEINQCIALVQRSGFRPNYFEFLYAFIFWEFARQKLDYAVIEVGVGGLLDCTNTMSRLDKVCILTDVGLDHIGVLGNTLAEIATHKAGIIQLHNSVLCWRQPTEVMQVFQAVAKQRQADLHVLDQPALPPDQCAFLPLFQRRNFELALAAVRLAVRRDHSRLSQAAINRAAHTVIPARMEIVRFQGKTVIVDGAHNAQKLQALAESVRSRFPSQDVAVLTGFAKASAEHRVDSSVRQLAGLASQLILTGFTINYRQPKPSIPPERAAAACKAIGYDHYQVFHEPQHAFAALLARPEPVLLVTGSFFLLNHIRPLLAATAQPAVEP